MRLAYFTPLNPQPSGISDYSEELLPHITSEAEVTLFVDGFEPSSPEIRKLFNWHDYRRDPAILRTLHEYDAVVYHLGNDHRYHAGMLQVMRAHPGIVVFHDFALQDFFLGLAQERRRIEIYLEEVLACHGARATRQAAEALERGNTPPQLDQPTEFPLNCRIARGAEGIIVHSEWGRVRFRAAAPSVLVAHINMPIKPLRNHRSATMAPGDGTAPGTVQIATFGLITPGKGIEKALRALSSLKADHDFYYTLVGAPNSFFDVRALVREHEMEDRVTITGHVSLDEFERRMATTDIALNLRERTVGETSASLCRIMGAGVPAIVFNVGAFSELPGDAVVKIDHDRSADALLTAYLRRLIEDNGLRERIGQNARRHIVENHDIKAGAMKYLAFIREVIAGRPRKGFVHSVAQQISQLGVGANSDSLLRKVAEDVAVLVPAAEVPGALIRSAAAGNGHTNPKRLEELPARSPGRLPKIEGIDYKRAALAYPQMLDAERSYYLRTKPFYNLANKPDKHLATAWTPKLIVRFTDFANMASVALPAGARILDGVRLGLVERIFRASRLRRNWN